MRRLTPHIIPGLLLTAAFLSCAAGPRVTESPPPGTESHGSANESPPALEIPQLDTPAEETVTAALPVGAALDSPIVLDSIAVLESQAESLPQKFLPETKMAGAGGPAEAPRTPIRLKPVIPEYIMGRGIILPEDMSAFLLGANPNAGKEFVESLAAIYLEEATIEGVNHDAAFAQMCLETGFLKFGGLVTPDMNNFCGLGATGPGQAGARFPDPRTGVRAHIQHLKAYATEAPLKQDLVDPRYGLVRSGSSPAIKGLSGTWAADRAYADKIKGILERLYNFVYEI